MDPREKIGMFRYSKMKLRNAFSLRQIFANYYTRYGNINRIFYIEIFAIGISTSSAIVYWNSFYLFADFMLFSYFFFSFSIYIFFVFLLHTSILQFVTCSLQQVFTMRNSRCNHDSLHVCICCNRLFYQCIGLINFHHTIIISQ